MNNANTFTSRTFSRRIVPFFMLSGLLALTAACSSSEPRPVAVEEPSEPVTIASTEKAPEKKIRVKAERPLQYTVKKGDTLWGIASLFLHDPWYWPEIWQNNPQVKNPHLIFPGDVLTLVYIDGQPRILVNDAKHRSVAKTANGMPVVKLSPSIRTTPLEASIPSIPGDAIRQFLSKPRVLPKKELEAAPRIIGSDKRHLVLSTGNRVYIRGELDKERVRFSVFRPGDKLLDPETDEVLGYEAKYAGNVLIKDYGDPATGDITFAEREMLIGDRLLPEDRSKLENLFFPHVPDFEIKGQIISLYDALFGVAQHQIVVINRGERDGMEVGHLLASYTQGETVRDRFDKRRSKPVKLPNERSGLIMIFKTFDRVSYALVLESDEVIHNHDYVQTPRL